MFNAFIKACNASYNALYGFRNYCNCSYNTLLYFLFIEHSFRKYDTTNNQFQL